MATHELGHALWWQLTHSELVMLVMGNGTQVLVPLLAGALFFAVRRNWVALGMCLAWCAAAIADTAVYVFDAPRGAHPDGLRRVGRGDQALGDWARVLGPEHLDKLYLADRWAADLRVWAVLFWLTGVVVIVIGLAITFKQMRNRRMSPAAPTTTGPGSRAAAPHRPERPWVLYPERPR
ncbi:MAG: hypothetical protein U0V56_09420 [Actinomycetota bacterium]